MGANYSFEVKNIEIWVPAFFKHDNSSVATVALFRTKEPSVAADLKVGHFYFSWPPLTSATSVRWKTLNFIEDFDVEKREDFGVI